MNQKNKLTKTPILSGYKYRRIYLLMKKIPWHFRKNKHRKSGGKKIGGHPSLVFGESDDGSKFYNLELTHSKKRGHHKNIKIHNPKDWSESSYIRDDIQLDQKSI